MRKDPKVGGGVSELAKSPRTKPNTHQGKDKTGDHPKAYAANIYNNRPPYQQQHYDPPSSSTHNPGWRNQAPFQNDNVGHNRPSFVPPPIQQQRQQMINNPAPTEPSLEELVRQMTMQNMQFQQETKASIHI
ncbi:hypothetical protein Lal_00024134 [Lupinus albus]|nr:hypothetical protein Lal_00024134 [Lupinus albus]